MKQVKKSRTIFTESRRDLLASCLVVVSAFVLVFSWTAIAAQAFVLLLLVLGIYGLTLWALVHLFTNRSRSRTLLDFITPIAVIEAALSIFLIWAVFNLQV